LTSPAPLDGVSVAELGNLVAAPYAGKLLADLGADVYKFELCLSNSTDAGDIARRYGPFPTATPDDEHSGLFGYLNRGKRSIAVDADTDSLERIDGILRGAEIIIVDDYFRRHYPPAGDAYDLSKRYPDSVIVAMTPFGLEGPLAHFNGNHEVCCAAGGVSFGVGEAQRGPLALPFFQGDFQAGLVAGIGALVGLFVRRRGGPGQVIDVSEHEVLASLHTAYFLPRYVYGGGIVGRRAGRTGGGTPYPDTILRCADGLVALNTPQRDQWKRFVDLMGNPPWAELPRYQDRRKMQWEYKAEVDDLVTRWLHKWTKKELVTMFLASRLPYAPLLKGEDLVSDPHLEARRAIAVYQHSAGDGEFRAPDRAFRLGDESVHYPRHAPRLGEHTNSVSALPYLPAAQLSAEWADGAQSPLSGIRVLDFGTAWAGGIVGRVLGDFGADVIKIESWSHMDGSRMGRPIIVDDVAGGDQGNWPDMQPGFHVHGRNKRSIALNLRTPEALSVVNRLLASSDVAAHNFSPGVMDRLGLSRSSMHERNPHLIVVGQSAAGETGPLSSYIGYNSTISALAGLATQVGYPGEEPIGRFQGLYCDVTSALTTVVAILAALLARERGQVNLWADVSQWEASLAIAPNTLLEYTIVGTEARAEPAGSRIFGPCGNYPCSESDEWICISVYGDDEWQSLSLLMGHPELAQDRRFATRSARQAHHEDLDRIVSHWTVGFTLDAIVPLLQEVGIAAYRVCNIESVFIDPQLNARSAFVELEHPLVGLEPMPGVPWKLSATPGGVFRRAPLLGEHNREVLLGVLGLSENEFAELIRVGAVETGPSREQGVGKSHRDGG